MKQCNELDQVDHRIVFPVLASNCCFAHPENILIAAIADDDVEVRRVAFERINAARVNVVSSAVRQFDKNNIILNFAAQSYTDMTD